MKETLESIFKTARDGRHFTELLEKENLKIYQRGKQYGIIDRDGIKYRFSTLGLTEEWEALDTRMMENPQKQKATQNTKQDTTKTAEKPQDKEWTKYTKTVEQKFEAMQKEKDGMSITNAELNVAFTRERVKRVWSFPHDVTQDTDQIQSKQEQEEALNRVFTETTTPTQKETHQEKPEQENEAVKKQTQNDNAEIQATGTSPLTVAKEFLLHPLDNPIQREMEAEQQRRLEEAKAMREAKANNQASASNKNQSS